MKWPHFLKSDIARGAAGVSNLALEERRDLDAAVLGLQIDVNPQNVKEHLLLVHYDKSHGFCKCSAWKRCPRAM
jgi:hypothetical protein